VKRALAIALLAAVAFAGVLLARMPASWVLPAHAGQASCALLEGTLWSGACEGLSVAGRTVGDVTWDLHPLRLLAGKLAAHATLAHGAVSARGDVELGLGQHLTVRNLVGDLPLDPNLIPAVPPTLSGRAHVEFALAEIQRGVVTRLQGRIEAHDLTDRSGNATPLGSYIVTFPGGTAEPVGQLHDLDGPLALEGTLRLTRQGGFELEGLVAPRAGAPPELIDSIRFFGTPDATGRRPFSVSGTF
jgi:general secretion pathway protein N